MMLLSRAALTPVWRELRVGLMYFSALHFSIASIVKEAMPARDIIPLTPEVRFHALGALLLLTVALYAADAALARAWRGRTHFAFRVTFLSVCLVLILGRLVPHVVVFRFILLLANVVHPLAVIALCLLTFAIVFLITRRFYAVAVSGFVYLSAVAVVVTAIWFADDLAAHPLYDAYSAAEVRHSSSDAPPVIVIVFDELAYESLLDGRGAIDERRYPNFARLGRESLAFSNATSNYFDTWIVLPTMIDAAVSLVPDRDLSLYEQTARIERLYGPRCGVDYTCRGAGYLTAPRSSDLSLHIGVHGLHTAVPDDIRNVIWPSLGWLRQITGVPAAGDPIYLHMNSERMVDRLVDDIGANELAGRVVFFHTMLPHGPYIFGDDSPAERDAWVQFHWNRRQDEATARRIFNAYDQQIRHADAALGRVIAALEDAGLYDTATLLVTADHGIRTDGPVDGQFEPAVNSLATHVPLFIRAPGLTAQWTDRDYQHIDFAATLYQLTDVSPARFAPAASHIALDGAAPMSALSSDRPARGKTFFVHGEGASFWRFELNPSTAHWDYVDVVEAATGDRTALD
jgi:hypothetical protein